MKAIILAAGEGRRMLPLTREQPKCLTIFNSKTLIEQVIDSLQAIEVDDIIVVTGYRHARLMSHLASTSVRFIHNVDFRNTNMLYSLFCARDEMDDDIIISYSDIVFSQDVLSGLIQSGDSIVVTVDKLWQRLWKLRMENVLDDAESMKLSADGYIKELGQRPDSLNAIEGQYIGLTLFRLPILPTIISCYDNIRNLRMKGRTREQLHMTDFLQYLVEQGLSIKANIIRAGWLEFDTVRDVTTYTKYFDTIPTPKALTEAERNQR